jgi:surface antigen
MSRRAATEPFLRLARGVAIVALVVAASDSAAADPAGVRAEARQPVVAAADALQDDARQDEDDEIATLEAIGIALSEVGDGNAYVWRRRHGRLGGFVQPTASFKDPGGRVCRHVLLQLTRAGRVGRAEGIACRLGDGRWELDR